MNKEELIKNLRIEGYLKTRKIIRAFIDIPREEFVTKEYKDQAYADYPLPIFNNQTVSAPHMVCLMTELLEPKNTDKVLEIGSGSGYQAAILSRLVKEVYTIEIDSQLAEFAKTNLKRIGVKNVMVIIGDGSKGYEKERPYDKVIVTCATPKIFDTWVDQLKENGIILVPVGAGFYQTLIKARKEEGRLKTENHETCAFVHMRSRASMI